MVEKIIKSFYDWCIENNRQDLLDRWDYNLNQKQPCEISIKSSEKFWLKCNTHKNHKSELFYLKGEISRNAYFKCRQCNSFAQYLLDTFGDNGIDMYWSNLNQIDPWNIYKSCITQVLIKCQNTDYHKDYLIHCCNFTSGNRCPYCRGRKIHPNDSFAQYHINHTDEDFLNKYWDYEKNNEININPWELAVNSKTKVYLYCQKVSYHGSSYIMAEEFTRGVRCSYCGSHSVHYFDSLGYLYPQSISIWSDKNKQSPFDYSPSSEKKVWWRCPEGIHDDYLRSVSGATQYNFRCYNCTKLLKDSMLQKKVSTYITENYDYDLKHEYDCSIIPQNPKKNGSRGSMPFDNEIVNLKLVIEVQGEQHYRTKSYNSIWKDKLLKPEESLHKQKVRDRYKKYVAFCKGYFYLAIPYWTEKDESYKTLIDEKISEILKLKEGDRHGFR